MDTWGVAVDRPADVLGVVLAKLVLQRLADIAEGRQV